MTKTIVNILALKHNYGYLLISRIPQMQEIKKLLYFCTENDHYSFSCVRKSWNSTIAQKMGGVLWMKIMKFFRINYYLISRTK